MKTAFRLVGLSKPKSATCLTESGDTFNIPMSMANDRFDALFKYFKTGEWEGHEKALIDHDGLFEGVPIDGTVIEIIL